MPTDVPEPTPCRPEPELWNSTGPPDDWDQRYPETDWDQRYPDAEVSP